MVHSDHAAVTSAVGTVLLMGGEPAWGALGIVGGALIGVARVVAGAYYPSEILGGILVGAFSGNRSLITPRLATIPPTSDRLSPLRDALRPPRSDGGARRRRGSVEVPE